MNITTNEKQWLNKTVFSHCGGDNWVKIYNYRKNQNRSENDKIYTNWCTYV